MNDLGIEYTDSSGETPFEVFLRYTDEKKVSSEVLAKILQDLLTQDGMSILDVGAGTGEYISLALDKVNALPKIELTLLEPSGDLADEIENQLSTLSGRIDKKVILEKFEDYETQERFDVVLASHLYHIKREEITETYSKMYGLLKDHGHLIIVFRDKDDVYDFKNLFKPRLFPDYDEALSMEDILSRLPGEIERSEIQQQEVSSTANVPINENPADSAAIISFYLSYAWRDTPADVRENTIEYARQRNGVFHQKDRILVIRKK